eukprot:199355-Amphidinium_carterae.1
MSSMACLCTALTHILSCMACKTCAGSMLASSSSTAHIMMIISGEALLGNLRAARANLRRMHLNFVAEIPMVAEPHTMEAVTPA